VVECIAERGATACSGGDVTVAGCSPEFDAIIACAACAPDSGDTSCGACLKASCCSELATFGVRSDAQIYLECIDACGSSASCFDSCGRVYPAAEAAFEDLFDCVDLRCSSPCS
jgi:hypothetical protein